MSTISYRWVLILVFVLLSFGLTIREWTLLPDGNMHLRFLSVGQGDSAMISTPEGKTIVIDGGPDWSTLEELGKHLPFFSRRIDLLVLSHPNLDHLLSFPEILRRYKVGGILMSGVEDALPRYGEIFALAEQNGIPIIAVSAGQSIEVEDNVTMAILWPPKTMPKGFTKNDNDASVVVMLKYKDQRALFTGDIEKPAEETLVRAHADLKADILKVAHHGSKTSNADAFLRAVSPSLAVISVGKNSYGHPRPEILERLKSMGVETHRTDLEGTIEVSW